MPFCAQNLPYALKKSLIMFYREQDFIKLYKAYSWEGDTYPNGFPNILKLETCLKRAAMNNQITKQHLIFVAKWGKYRNLKRIKCPAGTLKIRLYRENNLPLRYLSGDPIRPIVSLQRQVKGLGPTYLSKVIRFALPDEYGAIDTRIVRVFGHGDPASKKQSWLDMKAVNYDYGWYIPREQAAWPKDYAKWVNILRFFADILNNPKNQCSCPHPANFVNQGLRLKSVWICADVEMALFSYVSKLIK